jgi:hypothetical protein
MVASFRSQAQGGAAFTDLYRSATPALRRVAIILARPEGQALES